MTKMTSKVLASSLVILTTLGLAGYTSSAATPATKSTTAKAKVVKSSPANTNSKTEKAAVKSQTVKDTNSTSNDQLTTAASQKTTQESQNTSQVSSATTNSDQQVLTSFAKTSGVQQDGNHYYVAKGNDNNYQIEVRNSEGGDPNIAHLTGTYQYDPTTNQLHELNPITGDYNN